MNNECTEERKEEQWTRMNGTKEWEDKRLEMKSERESRKR